MVKYIQVNIAVNGNSNSVNPTESRGRWLQAPAVSILRMCARERKVFKVINESGTASLYDPPLVPVAQEVFLFFRRKNYVSLQFVIS